MNPQDLLRTENPRVLRQMPRLHGLEDYECRACGATREVATIYEPDTGAYYLDPPECPNCGEAWE